MNTLYVYRYKYNAQEVSKEVERASEMKAVGFFVSQATCRTEACWRAKVGWRAEKGGKKRSKDSKNKKRSKDPKPF